MDEPLIRLLVVAGVAAAALLVAMIARRGVALRRRPVEMPDLGPGLVLFTADTCSSCDRARRVVDEVGVEMVEIRYEETPEPFTRYGVDRVPALAHLDPDGRGWLAEGIPNRRLLTRWLSGSES